MFERFNVTSFISGALFGFCIATIIAGWLWAHFSKWWVGKPTNKQLDEKLIENMIEEEQWTSHG